MASERPPQTLRRPTPSAPTRLEKIVIGSLDDPHVGVEAQYNPRELTIDKAVPWTEHKVTKKDDPDLEFTGGGARTMSLELTFDGFESGQSVEDSVDALTAMAQVRQPDAHDAELLRPHRVAVVWGSRETKTPAFRGVIESLSTKFTMFLPDGTPARAVCTIKIKEAQRPGVAKAR